MNTKPVSMTGKNRQAGISLSLRKKVVAGLFLALLLVAGFLGVRLYNAKRFHLEKDVRLLMDTYVTIYAVGPKKITTRAIDLAFKRMQEVDTKFSIHNPESPLYAFNHRGVPVSDPEILDVVRFALEVSKETDGAFDITTAPLSELWGFYEDSPHLPTDQEIKKCLSRIGYKNLSINNGMLEKIKPDVRIDLGGVAKGYSISEAAKVLKDNGVMSALIDAGGDVYALGRKGRDLWKIGIRNPRASELLGYLEAEDIAVLGSGDYQRFFIKDGQRYHHILDPATGYPAEGLSSITLIYPDPMVGDAWTTAAFVLGPEKGLEAVEKMPGMEVLMITTSGEKYFSSGLKNQLMQIPKND